MRLFEAAEAVQSLLDQLDDGELAIDIALFEQFETAKDEMAKSIDKRKLYVAEIDGRIAICKARIDEARKAQQKYERLRDNIVKHTYNLVRMHPEIKFRDSLGKQVFIAKSAFPKFRLDEERVEERFMKDVPTIDKDAIKEFLKNGGQLEYASLEWSDHLRGL